MATEQSYAEQPRESQRAAEQLLEIVPRLMRLLAADAQAGEPGAALTVTQFRTLGLLKRRGGTPGELARVLGITPATASEVVDLLVRRGLVERGDLPGDRRVTPLRLTPEGLARLDSARARTLAALGALLDRLAPADRAALAGGLDALLEVLRGEAAEERSERGG